MQDLMTVPAEDLGGDTALAAADQAAADVSSDTAADDAKTTVSEDAEKPMTMPEEWMYMPVYNGEVRPMRATDRQEITTLLQLGMKQRDFLPSYKRLERFAKEQGHVSVKALIDSLCGEETACLQHAAESPKEELEAERQPFSRMSAQFRELQEEYPQFAAFDDVPAHIIESAVRNGISLLDAQNRFELAEHRRMADAAAVQREASRASTGSLADGGADVKPTALEAFLNGLNRRI